MASTRLLDDPARAWAPFEPSAKEPWDLGRVAHLHRRAGFSAPWGVLQRDLKEGPEASVARLLKGEALTPDGRPADAFEALADAMDRQLAPGAALTRLQAIWLHRMVYTAHPLRERMTLFWHDHFATSQTKVQNAELMRRQIALFRRHALGDFRTLLAEVGKDPAMLIWLDSTENRKAHPNENYAREVMELFSLGRGNYTEADVREAARAFTGWFVRRDRFEEVKAEHDDGPKTVLGRKGSFDGDAIPEILLSQPACAEFLCTKLVRAFVTEVDPVSPALVAPLAGAFRDSHYDISVPVRMILRSNLFFDPSVRRRRVKSPVEFAVGTVRAMEVLRPTVKADALAEACSRMGQSLYAPPSVAGWDGGPAWINSTTLLSRANLALAVASTTDADLGRRLDPVALAARHGASGPNEPTGFLADLLVQDGLDAGLRAKVSAAARSNAGGPAAQAREAAVLILTSPEYQLA
ncbi:MAG: DUF1800 domain-containing protein [Isosphaeraceae bacterium]